VTFRHRLTLVSAIAVAVAVAAASFATWFVVRSQLRGQIDDSLVERARFAGAIPFGSPGGFSPPHHGPGDPSIYIQLVTPEGDVLVPAGETELGLAPTAVGEGVTLSNATVDGVNYRVLSVAAGDGFTVMLARPLTEVDQTLRQLVMMLLFVTAGGVALAVGLGMVVTRAAAAPVARLTEAAERVSETGDLSLRIEEPGTDDEVGRLASRFNAMLETLEGSVAAQRQLVADASHELRTPLTAVRTNIDLLASGRLTDPAERERLLADVRAQLEELTAIVNDLVELARGAEQPEVFEDVRLDDVVRDAISRFERLEPSASVAADLEPSVVTGDAARISRAVRNLLDNAGKWNADGVPIEVSVRGQVVTVRDHGPGFAQEDQPYVFDRFYRATAARGMPGSGLGLAIVRQVAEAHGGRAVAENAPGGGAIVRLELSSDSQTPLTEGSPTGD
jgi:two-component system sensor histidine kinase MprB